LQTAPALFAGHIEVIDYVSRALVEGIPIGARIFDGLVEISTGHWNRLNEEGLTRPDLDPIWHTLNPLTLVLGMFMLRTHLSRHLPEALTSPEQLLRWRNATEVIIAFGHLRPADQKPLVD
jgi:hypothetical protein